jgi:hypothetical protein
MGVQPALAANETRDFSKNGVEIVADVESSKLDKDHAHSEFRINFGTPGKENTSGLWSNGIFLYCSSRENTVFVNGAGSFGFDMNALDKGQDANIMLATDSHEIKSASRQSIVTHDGVFNVWAGVDGIGMQSLTDGLANGETLYFLINEPDTGLTSVTVTLQNVEGHNNFSAFRKYCANYWHAAS